MTLDKDKRIINLRVLLISFVGMILAVLTSTFLLTNKMSVFAFVSTIVIVTLVVALGILYSFKLKKSCENTKFRTKVPYLLRWSSIGFGIAFIIGICVSISPVLQITNIATYDAPVVVTGVVCDYVDREDTYIQFLMKDCKIISEDNSEKIDLKVVVNTSIYSDVSLGDIITIEGELSAFDINDSYGLSRLSQGIGYSTYASTNNIVKTSGDMEFKDLVHSEVKGILDDNLNSDNSEICFAVLFGQKYGLSESIKNMFSYAGISHILAVSGLHVGVLVSLIWSALKKLKINDYIKLFVFAGVLIFYAYLCSFSPSVCRAGLMAFVLALCKIKCWEYDISNSLGLAGLVILFASPLSLFSVSFQLSFICIFAIITFAPFIRSCLNKIKCPKLLSNALAISIAVNIVILPVCINVFSEVSLLGIVANIFILPIFSITYILLFIVMILSLIIKPLGLLLVVPNLFLHLIKTIAYYFSLIPFGIFRVFSVSYWLLVLVFIVIITIHYIMSKHWIKYLSVIILSISCITVIVFGCLPKDYSEDVLIIDAQYNTNIIFYIEEDENVMLGSNITLEELNKLTRNLRIKEIDKIIACDLQLNKIDELTKICDNYHVDTIVLSSNMEYSAIVNNLPNVEIIEDYYNDYNLTINFINRGNDIVGIKLNKFTTNIIIPRLDNSKANNNYLLTKCTEIDYVVTHDYDFWEQSNVKIIDLSNTETVFM